MTLKTYKVGAKIIETEVSSPPRRDRLIRMCSPDMLYPGMACEYVPEQNMLKINRDLYEAANEKTRQKLWRSNESLSSI